MLNFVFQCRGFCRANSLMPKIKTKLRYLSSVTQGRDTSTWCMGQLFGILNLIAWVVFLPLQWKSFSKFQSIQRSEICWQEEPNKWHIAFRHFETKTDDRGLQILDYLFSLNNIMASYFAFSGKKLRAVCGTAVRRRDFFLWTDGIVLKSSGKNKAFLLLLICLISSLCCLHWWHLWGFSTGCALHNVRTVCCWTHLDLVQCAGNKSSAWKACSGCQRHPIGYSGIVEHSGAAVILLL